MNCPHCGVDEINHELQDPFKADRVLKPDRVLKADRVLKPDRVYTGIYYECLNCGHKWSESSNPLNEP